MPFAIAEVDGGCYQDVPVADAALKCTHERSFFLLVCIAEIAN